MKGRNLIGLGLATLAFLAAAPALAQEKRFELAVGPQFSLVSQKLEIDQELGYHVRFGVRYTPRLTVSAIAEFTETRSALPNRENHDMKLGLYGLNAALTLAGEDAFQLFATAGLGRGDLVFSPPLEGPGDEFYRDTKLKLWYDAGIGCTFAFGKTWGLRLQATARWFSPDEPTAVMGGGRFAIVPSADLVFRF